ncbi:hypothetical protein NL676_018623 [Syzygium grande]|nr:hypothetical protein NL676_018623 [Syzygium grande]
MCGMAIKERPFEESFVSIAVATSARLMYEPSDGYYLKTGTDRGWETPTAGPNWVLWSQPWMPMNMLSLNGCELCSRELCSCPELEACATGVSSHGSEH